MKTDAMIKREGFKVLKEKLGLVEFERFLMIISREKFNYTEWRKNLFEEESLEDLAKKANKFYKDNI